MQLATMIQAHGDPPPATVAAALVRGTVLGGRYVLEEVLGRGGCGTVFRAWDQLLGAGLALKVLTPELALGHVGHRRLAREVRLARAIRHPHVCPVFGLERTDGLTFLTMELARGSLADELADPDVRDATASRDVWDARLRDGEAVCRGLEAIHETGVAHRDLKPQNVLRMADGRLAIADFGIALAGTQDSGCGGTPNCLPPEVILGLPTDRRSDLWQLGLLLHEILLGERPGWSLVSGKAPVPIGRACDVPRDVAPLLDAAAACLSLCPDDRPTSAEVARFASSCRGALRTPG